MKHPRAIIKLMSFAITMQGMCNLLSGCSQWFHPDNINMARSGLPVVETDPRYMQCKDFTPTKEGQPSDTTDSEKVVILYSSGGSGHKSAADAVARALHAAEEKMLGKGHKFSIAQVDVLYDLLPKNELFDEYMKAENWEKLKSLVAMQGLAEKMVNMRQFLWDNKVFNRIMHACDHRPPTMLISVFPVANYVYADIAKKHNIPLVIVPTDYEISHFIRNLDETDNQTPHVFMGLPLKEPEVTTPLYPKDATVPIVPYCIVGSPVRNEFTALRSKINTSATDPSEIVLYRKSTLKIASDAKSILITLGGKGGALEVILQYLQKLHAMQKSSDFKHGLHVVVASGGDQKILDGLKANASTFANTNQFKTTILGQLDATNMALTMASVDAVLLKPGGSTVSEAIMLGTPMIIKSDSTSALPWEKTNMLLAIRKGWAVDLVPTTDNKIDGNDLIAKVKQVLTAPIRRHQTPFINFQTEFPRMIDKINHRSLTPEAEPLCCVQ